MTFISVAVGKIIEMIVYSDGSCIGNPGNGGWCFLFTNENYLRSGCSKNTTNNRMELQAVIEALRYGEEKMYVEFEIHTDSQYVINCALRLFKRKKNLDLWEQYDLLSKDKVVKYVWVKGHSGDKFNEVVDMVAQKEAKSCL